MAPKSATRRAFGQLRQLPSGRWQAAYTGPDSNRHKAPRTYAVEDDAIGWLDVERRKIDLGTWGAFERSDGITLRTYADRWIEQRQLRPRTSAALRVDAQSVDPARPRRREDRHADAGQDPPWHADLGTAHPTRNAHAYALLHADLRHRRAG